MSTARATTMLSASRHRARAPARGVARGVARATTRVVVMRPLSTRAPIRKENARARASSSTGTSSSYASWDEGDFDVFEREPRGRFGEGRERGDFDFSGRARGRRGGDEFDERDEYEPSRTRDARDRGSGFEMSANILKLAYVALTNVSEAFTRALDVLLPRSVPMYVIRFIVACGWGAFALLSASRLIYGVVVIGAVLCLAVALGNDDGADAKGRAAGMYEYATDSTPRGRRRREDFDERRRAAARERKRRSADFEYEDIYGDGAFDAFDAKAFERGAEVFSEAFGDRLKAKEAFRAAQDVTVEVRQWGDEALDEFKKAFNLNAGDFDFEDDVAEVDFSQTRASNRPPSAEDEGGGLVRIIDVDALTKDVDSTTTTATTAKVQEKPYSADVSFDEWLGTTSASSSNASARADDFFEVEDEQSWPSDDAEDAFSEAFRDGFEGEFGTSSRTRTGASRNWFSEFLSGNFRGAFQEDLIPATFDEEDAERGGPR